jgi:DNA-directed RNA polymerase II subunit RPB11
MPNKVGLLVEDAPNCKLRNNLKENRLINHKPDYDAGNRFELFILDDGEKKVEWKDETRTFTLFSPHERSLLISAALFRRP